MVSEVFYRLFDLYVVVIGFFFSIMLKCKVYISLCMVDIFVIFISNYYYKNWNYCYIVIEELLFGKYLREIRFCSVLFFVYEFLCFINYLLMNVCVFFNILIFRGFL